MLVVMSTFLFPKLKTLELPFLSGATLSVSCWLSPQAFPLHLAAVTATLNIPLFNAPGGGRLGLHVLTGASSLPAPT